jgi:hypothetical protein
MMNTSPQLAFPKYPVTIVGLPALVLAFHAVAAFTLNL